MTGLLQKQTEQTQSENPLAANSSPCFSRRCYFFLSLVVFSPPFPIPQMSTEGASDNHLLVYDRFASERLLVRKSHEPTMAIDLFLAGIQEQGQLPRSGLFVLLSACSWICFCPGRRKPPQAARRHGPDADCRASRERSGKGARLERPRFNAQDSA